MSAATAEELLKRMRRASAFVDPPEAMTPLLDAVEAVLELHQPFETRVLTGSCSIEACAHEDECPTIPFWYCAACDALADEIDTYYSERGMAPTAYPCPTVRAINDALGVES